MIYLFQLTDDKLFEQGINQGINFDKFDNIKVMIWVKDSYRGQKVIFEVAEAEFWILSNIRFLLENSVWVSRLFDLGDIKNHR